MLRLFCHDYQAAFLITAIEIKLINGWFYITLEGRTYESGRFLFNPGDYLLFNPEDAAEYQG